MPCVRLNWLFLALNARYTIAHHNSCISWP